MVNRKKERKAAMSRATVFPEAPESEREMTNATQSSVVAFSTVAPRDSSHERKIVTVVA